MQKIAEDLYQLALMPRHAINCYLAGDILIDAGIRSSAPAILRMLRNSPVSAHALTHAHADHQGSSAAVCKTLGIPLWVSGPELEAATSGQVTDTYPGRHLIGHFQQKYWAGPGYPVSRILKEGDRVGSFTVVETPGHSPGHISFFREKDGVLILGDVLTGMHLLSTRRGLYEPPAMFTADRELNRMSIRKIHSLRPSLICFGHGPILDNPRWLDDFVKKL